jgi:hypothetical protein
MPAKGVISPRTPHPIADSSAGARDFVHQRLQERCQTRGVNREASSWRPGYPVDDRGEKLRLRDATGPYGDFEAKAARVVARATGERVVLQDDNRLPRTPDLRIDYADGQRGVGEIVTITDGQRAAMTAAFTNGGLNLQSERLRWQWFVTVKADAKRTILASRLVDVLAQMEVADERHSLLGPIDPVTAGPGAKKLYELGVAEVASNTVPADRRGQVVWQMEGIGGELKLDWEGFHSGLQSVLVSSLVCGKRDKLVAVAGALERHLFIGLSWSVPWALLRVLESDVDELPRRPPALPDGVSHLWLWGSELPGRALGW